MKTPCEIIVWDIVPIIRKEFAKNLIENNGLNQKEVAEKLVISAIRFKYVRVVFNT